MNEAYLTVSLVTYAAVITGFIVLPGAQIINHTEDNAGPTEFAIIEKRKYVLKAASADDKKEWMAALQVRLLH